MARQFRVFVRTINGAKQYRAQDTSPWLRKDLFDKMYSGIEYILVTEDAGVYAHAS